MNHDSKGRRGVSIAAAVLGVAFAAGCEVTNPGPVADDFLTLPDAQQGFVNGSKERLGRAVSNAAYNTAEFAREVFPGGTTGSYGNNINVQAGNMEWNESGPDGEYNAGQQARWIAEEALRRFTALGNVNAQIMTEAYVWAGYANRFLGENYCEAVIDGGPLQPGKVYFERAEKHFTDAIAKAPASTAGTQWKLAAYAGRAQARLWLENFAGAEADAKMVTDNNFKFVADLDYTTGSNADQRNHIYFAAASTPYRSITVKFTFFDQYYTDTGDPRTPWIKYTIPTDTLCVGSFQGYPGGRVPCTRPWKYKSENDDIRLSSGREMRLIEAEVKLVAGDLAGGVAIINAMRTQIDSDKGGKLAPYPAPATAEEAWTYLKRERGIELWLEARRMGDQRRWEPIMGQPKRPGSIDLPNFEAKSPTFTLYPRGREVVEGQPNGQRVLCYNISDNERNTNQNIPDHNA